MARGLEHQVQVVAAVDEVGQGRGCGVGKGPAFRAHHHQLALAQRQRRANGRRGRAQADRKISLFQAQAQARAAFRVAQQGHHALPGGMDEDVAAVLHDDVRAYPRKMVGHQLGEGSGHGGHGADVHQVGGFCHFPGHQGGVCRRGHRAQTLAKARGQQHEAFELAAQAAHQVEHGDGEVALGGDEEVGLLQHHLERHLAVLRGDGVAIAAVGGKEDLLRHALEGTRTKRRRKGTTRAPA